MTVIHFSNFRHEELCVIPPRKKPRLKMKKSANLIVTSLIVALNFIIESGKCSMNKACKIFIEPT